MNNLVDAIIYILFFGVIPLAYCVLTFRWIVGFLSKMDIAKKTLSTCVLCAAGFVVFQLVSIVPLDVGNISDRLDFSLVYSWIGVLNYILIGTGLEDWFPNNWVIELIYFLCYMLIGLAMAGGMKLWKNRTPARYFGLGVLVLCFCIYSFGIFFWMVTGLYL